MNFIATVLSIGIGATIGASLRYYIGVLFAQILHKDSFYATLTSNIIGCFMAGIVVFIIIEKMSLSEFYKLLFLVGLAGSISTMAALSIDSINMIINGNYLKSFLNILVNVTLSLLSAFIAIIIAKYFLT